MRGDDVGSLTVSREPSIQRRPVYYGQFIVGRLKSVSFFFHARL